MTTNLSLDIDQKVVEKAEIYAKYYKKTISQLVEDYLIIVTSENEGENIQLGPITSQLAGIIELDSSKNYKELLTDALMEEHI